MRELMGMLLDIFYDIDTRGEPKKKKKKHSQETKP